MRAVAAEGQSIAYGPLDHTDATVLSIEVIQQIAQDLGGSPAQVSAPHPSPRLYFEACKCFEHHLTWRRFRKNTIPRCVMLLVLCCVVTYVGYPVM